MLRFAPPPHTVLGFDDTTTSAEARDAVRVLLKDSSTVDACERTELAVSELVQNALGLDSPVAVSMWHEVDQRAIRVEVEDTAPGEPAIRSGDSWGRGGFGLRIVDAVVNRWGVIQHRSSKSLWFEIDY